MVGLLLALFEDVLVAWISAARSIGLDPSSSLDANLAVKAHIVGRKSRYTPGPIGVAIPDEPG